MDNINQNSGSLLNYSEPSHGIGYSGNTYGDFATPVLMRNPVSGEVKFFSHSCTHNSTNNFILVRSVEATGTTTNPFQPSSTEVVSSSSYSKWYPNSTGTGTSYDMYSDTNGSNGYHYYYNPQPCRPAGDNYYFMIGQRQDGPIYSDNVLANTVYWKRPGWWITDPVTGYGPGNFTLNNYAWTETGTHMVFPTNLNGQNHFWIRVITPDISAGENVLTTETYTDVNIASRLMGSDYSSNAYLRGMWAQGSRIFIGHMYYTTSNQYDWKIWYCDFAVNDGTDPNHWILAHTEGNKSFTVYQGGCGVQENGTKMYIVDASGHTLQSSNNGTSWTYSYQPLSSKRNDLWRSNELYYHNAAYIDDLLYVAVRRRSVTDAYALSGNTIQGSEYYSTFWSSHDNGINWNWENFGLHSDIAASYPQLEQAHGGRGISIREEGGWIVIRGRSTGDMRMMGFAIPHYQTVTFADTTNLTNESFRTGNMVRQGSVTFHIAESAQTTKVYSIKGGDIVTGSPVTNTVSYFGGSQSTLYAVLSGAGAITDLTSSDPGFVNLGYGVDNTITFPATFPSGATPDVELPAGTTMQATVEFANSQGTVTADSNTLTP